MRNVEKRYKIVGKKFGSWTVVCFWHVKGSAYYYSCICDCGTRGLVVRNNLITGNSTCCGCTRKPVTTHGLRNHRLYQTWRNMLSRCYKPSRPDYKHYGGRGIFVKKEWHNIEKFIEDMYPSFPGNPYSLDRIDNDLGYCKENCRWASIKEQRVNTRAQKRPYVGVYKWGNKFESRLNRKRIGVFKTREEAVIARKKAELEMQEPN